MAVRYLTDNDDKIFVLHFSGYVSECDLHAALAGMFGAATEGTYRHLLIFEAGVDLSAFDITALRNARTAADGASAQVGIARGKSAAMVDAAVDANMVMPVWNALCDADAADDYRFALFREMRPALDYLDAPPGFAARIGAVA